MTSGIDSQPHDSLGHAWFVVHEPGRAPRTVNLEHEITIGRDIGLPENDQHLATHGDPTVSRLHSVVTPKAPGWCVQATDATNGLFVNGIRLSAGAVQLLAPGDEIRLGERTMLQFHTTSNDAADRSLTITAGGLPDLTPGERRVLVSLCSPVLEGDAFIPPSTVPAIAADLFVSDSAVKQQLGRLYLKFDIDEGPDRRVRLANEALTRGAVRRADLKAARTQE